MPSSKDHLDQVFSSKDWGSTRHGTRSGVGSTMESTEAVRNELPRIMRNFGFVSLNDAGCGDISWMRTVVLPGVDYMGYDIRLMGSKEEANLKTMKAKRRGFKKLDFVNEDMRICDLVLCRDALIHLSNEDVLEALRRFRKVSKFLMATTDPSVDNEGRMKVSGGFSPINLELAPFILGLPLVTIDEPKWNRYVGLWRL